MLKRFHCRNFWRRIELFLSLATLALICVKVSRRERRAYLDNLSSQSLLPLPSPVPGDLSPGGGKVGARQEGGQAQAETVQPGKRGELLPPSHHYLPRDIVYSVYYMEYKEYQE